MKPLTPKFPKLLHGGDYNPEQWLRYPEVLKQDIELMKKADINCVSVGIFSWAHLEPEEGVYDFDWLAEIIDNLYQNGIYTVLATPSGAKPLWMSEKYEEIRRVQANGVRDLSGARHNHCYTSPVYREKVDGFLEPHIHRLVADSRAGAKRRDERPRAHARLEALRHAPDRRFYDA